MGKITFEDKVQTKVKVIHKNEIWDTDVNEMKAAINDNDTRVTFLEANKLNGVYYFKTYALMIAADATGKANYAYKVIADTDTTKNGDYTSDGSIYTHQTNAVNGFIASGNVDAISGDTAYKNSNSQRKYAVTQDSSILTIVGSILKTGVINTFAGFSRSDKIGVYNLDKIKLTINGQSSAGTCFFDKYNNFISGVDGFTYSATPGLVEVELTVPKNAEYMITSIADTYKTTSYYIQKQSFNNIGKNLYPTNQFTISDRNLNTYAGAMNTVIDALLTAKPTAIFVFISNYTEDLSSGEHAKQIINMQEMVANYWEADFLNLSKRIRMVYRDGADILGTYVPDRTHPGTDSTNGYRVVNLIARYCKQFLDPIFDTWVGKKIAWYGTSIPAGFNNESVDAAQYPKVTASLLGATCDNYAQSSSVVRKTKVDGSSFTNPSFTDLTNATANYVDHMVNLIGTANEPDIFVFDHGRNDYVVDGTDFIINNWNNKYK